jgi:hypothetical protein
MINLKLFEDNARTLLISSGKIFNLTRRMIKIEITKLLQDQCYFFATLALPNTTLFPEDKLINIPES